MRRLQQSVLLMIFMVLFGCVSVPRTVFKGHLSSEEVEALMAQGVIRTFDASRGGSGIVLDNGDAYEVDLPATEAIEAYLERRRSLGKPADFEIE